MALLTRKSRRTSEPWARPGRRNIDRHGSAGEPGCRCDEFPTSGPAGGDTADVGRIPVTRRRSRAGGAPPARRRPRSVRGRSAGPHGRWRRLPSVTPPLVAPADARCRRTVARRRPGGYVPRSTRSARRPWSPPSRACAVRTPTPSARSASRSTEIATPERRPRTGSRRVAPTASTAGSRAAGVRGAADRASVEVEHGLPGYPPAEQRLDRRTDAAPRTPPAHVHGQVPTGGEGDERGEVRPGA